MEEEEDRSFSEEEEETKSSKKDKADPKKIKEKKVSLRTSITEVSEEFTLTWNQILEKLPDLSVEIAADLTLMNWYKNKKKSPAIKAATWNPIINQMINSNLNENHRATLISQLE